VKSVDIAYAKDKLVTSARPTSRHRAVTQNGAPFKLTASGVPGKLYALSIGILLIANLPNVEKTAVSPPPRIGCQICNPFPARTDDCENCRT